MRMKRSCKRILSLLLVLLLACGGITAAAEELPQPIQVTLQDVTLANGDACTLTPVLSTLPPEGYTVTWSSSDPGIASVDAGGVVQAHAAGKTTVRCTLADADGAQLGEATCTVQVLSKAAKAAKDTWEKMLMKLFQPILEPVITAIAEKVVGKIIEEVAGAIFGAIFQGFSDALSKAIGDWIAGLIAGNNAVQAAL